MNQKHPNDKMYKDQDENLALLTPKIEESKCNKENFTLYLNTQ